MQNNERFDSMINASSDPRRMYNTLLALAPMFRAMNERKAASKESEKGGEEA